MRKKRLNDTRRPHWNKKSTDPTIKSGRSCRLCKKDTGPNYFYCPDCHALISRGADLRDQNSEGIHSIEAMMWA